ncbi:MAG: hypothetical protein HQK52_20330 [Oligoflexia bacterium]|nr:hypothetical protein [Oligoflexia bacterium]
MDFLLNIALSGVAGNIRTTVNHPFFSPTKQTWVDAKDLQVGDQLLTIDKKIVTVSKIEDEYGEFPVYNLHVDKNNTYYVSLDGVLVHNCGGSARTDAVETVARHADDIVKIGRDSGFSNVIYPRGQGASTLPAPSGYTKVSRWINESESKMWVEGGGTHIPTDVGAGGRVYVTSPGAPKPGGTGSIRVDFYVPEGMLQKAGNEQWFQIMQPQANTPIYNVEIFKP